MFFINTQMRFKIGVTMLSLNVDWMYFNAIRDGKIHALFFPNEVLSGLKKGEIFKIDCGRSTIKVYFKEVKMISFRNVTDKMVNEAGFKSKELLAYHLQQKYDIPNFTWITPNVSKAFEAELFFYIAFEDDPSKIFVSDGEVDYKLNSTSPTFGNVNYYQYNPDYSNHIWEDET